MAQSAQAPKMPTFTVPGELLQAMTTVIASLPFNHPAGDGVFCGDIVNAIRQLEPNPAPPALELVEPPLDGPLA